MAADQVNRWSSVALTALSATAFLLVLASYLPGQAEQADEGTKAHLFQLAIVALVPTFLVFFVTADWSQPLRMARRLAVPVLAVVLAFAALYYLENVYAPAHDPSRPRGGALSYQRPSTAARSSAMCAARTGVAPAVRVASA